MLELQEQAGGAREAPPYRRRTREQAAGEERRVPPLRHAEDDGDAGLQQRRPRPGCYRVAATAAAVAIAGVAGTTGVPPAAEAGGHAKSRRGTYRRAAQGGVGGLTACRREGLRLCRKQRAEVVCGARALSERICFRVKDSYFVEMMEREKHSVFRTPPFSAVVNKPDGGLHFAGVRIQRNEKKTERKLGACPVNDRAGNLGGFQTQV